MKPTTIYIADDHQIIIDGIQLLLSAEESLEIIGSGQSGNRVYDDLLKLKPDIGILDIRMPEKSGLQILQQLHKKIPTRFILLTMQMDKRSIIDAENFGASGFLLKNTGKDELLNCLYTVLNGQRYFPKMETPIQSSILSPRELDILSLVLKGLTTQQISEQLSLSPYTVETHRKNIYRKTESNNVAVLLKYAIDNGLYEG